MNKERKGFKDGSPYYFLIFIVTSIVNPSEPLYSWVILAWQAACRLLSHWEHAVGEFVVLGLGFTFGV